MIKKYEKNTVVQVKQSLGPFNMLTVHKCSDTGLFKDLNNPAFFTLEFEKEITSETHLLVQSISNSM